jgi:hypothetical protein
LEAWSKSGGKFTQQLPDTFYFNELSFFEFAVTEPATIAYTGLVKFAAFVFYLRKHEGAVESEAFQEWARVVRNLGDNTDIERTEDYGRCLSGLQKLLPHSNRILQQLAQMSVEPIGFSPQQVREEILKAKLMLSHPGWTARIIAAEKHGYFRGQIEFLLDFSGVSAQAEKIPPIDWKEKEHAGFQDNFDLYYKRAQLMFDSDGLIPVNDHLWKRALLTVGNYLLVSGRNESFLTNPPGNWDSWKRLLRNIGSSQRQHLKSLWDKINPIAPVEPQLSQIVRDASGLDPWRAAVVKYPQIIDYCNQQEIRRQSDSKEIYLLKKRQMNGFHAELFSYALHQELDSDASRKSLLPLKLQAYQSIKMTEFEPYLLLSFDCFKGRVDFQIYSSNGVFTVQTLASDLTKYPLVETALKNKCGFIISGDLLALSTSRDNIHNVLSQMASSLAGLPNPTS